MQWRQSTLTLLPATYERLQEQPCNLRCLWAKQLKWANICPSCMTLYAHIRYALDFRNASSISSMRPDIVSDKYTLALCDGSSSLYYPRGSGLHSERKNCHRGFAIFNSRQHSQASRSSYAELPIAMAWALGTQIHRASSTGPQGEAGVEER